MQVLAGIGVGGIVLPIPPIPVLDQLSAAARVAYGFRLLRAAYAGPALRLRRTSDNAETDIWFRLDGRVNSDAALAWCGAGNTATCTTIYDQSGNGFHGTQVTTSLQPLVINAGTWLGGLQGAANNHNMVIPSAAVSGLTAASVSSVGCRLGANPGGHHKLGGTTNAVHHPWTDGNIYTDFFTSTFGGLGGGAIPLAGIGTATTVTETHSGTVLTVYLNNVLRPGSTATVPFVTPTTLRFPHSNSGGNMRGYEMLLFGSLLSTADRNAATASQIAAGY